MLTFAPIVRILLDYRPALVTRTGVGEYVHRLAEALVRVSAGRRRDHALLQLLEGPAATRRDPGRRRRRRPAAGPAADGLWQRRDWPPVETPGRRAVGHRPVGPADAGAVADGRPADHRLRSRLPRPSRADPGRVHGPLRRAGPRARARDRSHHRHLGLHGRRSRGPARRPAQPRSPSAGRAARTGRCGWRRRPPRSAYLLFVGTLEPRKNVGGLLDAYAPAGRPQPAGAAARAGRSRPSPSRRRGSTRSQQPPFAGRVQHRGYVPDERARRRSTPAPRR